MLAYLLLAAHGNRVPKIHLWRLRNATKPLHPSQEPQLRVHPLCSWNRSRRAAGRVLTEFFIDQGSMKYDCSLGKTRALSLFKWVCPASKPPRGRRRIDSEWTDW
jgi:hypothetical protein